MLRSHSRSKKSLKLTTAILNKDETIHRASHSNMFDLHKKAKDRKLQEEQSEVFRVKYDKAIDLARQNNEASKRKAMKMLFSMCITFRDFPQGSRISGVLLENTLKNYLALKTMLGGNPELCKQQQLGFIRYFTTYLQSLHKNATKENTVTRQGLSLFFLIQANEEYHNKLYQQALRSCSKSVNYCTGTRVQIDIHLMKVEFLKSSIYGVIKDGKNQMEAVRQCLKLINNLYPNISDLQTKEYMLGLKKILSDKKQGISVPQMKNEQVEERPRNNSLNKFRTRSISLKKSQSKKQISLQKPVQTTLRGHTPMRLKLPQRDFKVEPTLVIKSASHSKHTSIQFENRKQYFTVTTNKGKKSQLKKKALKIEMNYNEPVSKSQINEYMIDEIQNERPPEFKFEDLMVERPKLKKEQKKQESCIQADDYDEFPQSPPNLMAQTKKWSGEGARASTIEPVTHYMNQGVSEMHSMLGNDYQELVMECIRQQEENIIKGYIKTSFISQELLLTKTRVKTQTEQPEKYKKTFTKIRDTDDGRLQEEPDQSSKNALQTNEKKLHFTRLRQTFAPHSLEANQHQLFSYDNTDFQIDSSMGICTYFGYLTNFQLKMKILSVYEEGKEENRIVLIQFEALLNDQQYVQAELKFQLGTIYDTDLFAVLYYLEKQLLPTGCQMYQRLSYRMLNLLNNQLFKKRKANGVVITSKDQQVVKKYSSIEEYKRDLLDRLINYELNNYTKKYFRKKPQEEKISQKKIKELRNIGEYQEQVKRDINKDVSENEEDERSDTFTNYLPMLMKKLTEDVKDDSSCISSIKKMRTDRMIKNTLFSYKSTMRSIDFGQCNVFIKQDDTKSLNAVIMPSDFHDKISGYFEQNQKKKQTIPYEQFYYCMKFVLIKPQNREDDLFISNFYDQLKVEYLHFLKNKDKIRIKMTCFRSKAIFRLDNSIFYKFQLQFISQKIKSAKFIATSKDLYMVQKVFSQKSSRKLDNDLSLRTSRRHQKQRNQTFQQIQQRPFKKQPMLQFLKQLSSNIIIKKNYLYSAVGFQNKTNHFNYINKFRLEGKTIQGKNFMTNHLKQIHIIFQKSIKIKCLAFRWFAVMTIRQILGSNQFNLLFYIPHIQKTFTVVLTRNVISYLRDEEIIKLFGDKPKKIEEIQKMFFGYFDDGEQKSKQRQLWNQFSKFLQFESRYLDDRIKILVKIGKYCGFLKDASFSEFFELEKHIYQLEMSLTKKGQPLSKQVQSKNKFKNLKIVKRKSSSTKQIAFRRQDSTQKSTNRHPRSRMMQFIPKERPSKENDSKNFKKCDYFEQLNEIYQSDLSKYVLYISLAELLQINDDDLDGSASVEATKAKKITFCFSLLDLGKLIKKSKEELRTLGFNTRVEFNQEVFSFALLLRTMTVIKHRIIKQLKNQLEKDQYFIEDLFEGQNTIENQKSFKNKLNEAFSSQNENACSLNVFKKYSYLDKNVFLIYKSIVSVKKSELTCFLYNQKEKTITFYLINSLSLENRHRTMKIDAMRFPWITFLKHHELVRVNRRIYSYYRNVLLIE